MQSSSKIILVLVTFAFVQIASSLPSSIQGSVEKKGEHTAADISNVVHAIQVSVCSNLQQNIVVPSKGEIHAINQAIKSTVEQSIFDNESRTEIAEKVKEVVVDIIAIEHDMPSGRKNAFWSSLLRDVKEAARNNKIFIGESSDDVPEYTPQDIDSDGGIPAGGPEPAEEEVSAVVYALQEVVNRKLEEKMVPLSKKEKNKVIHAIKNTAERSIYHNQSPAEFAAQTKQTVADIIVIQHDMPFGREKAFWSSLLRDVEEAVRMNPITIDDSTALFYAVQNAANMNLKRMVVPLSKQQKYEIRGAIKSLVDEAIFRNSSASEIAEKVKQVVGDIIVTENDMPFEREKAFWSSLLRDVEVAVEHHDIQLNNYCKL